MKILAHTPFIGNSGYANHARSFFCALNKIHEVKVRCSTVGDGWDGFNSTPHNNEPYITDEMKDMIILQTLINTDGSKSDYRIYNYKGDYKPDVHIVLSEVHNHYFYDDYDGYKIAYNVWESTRYPEDFFQRLKYFDEVWVPTQWQFDSLVTQGYPENKISIVTEGVDVNTFFPTHSSQENFRFLLFGRWEHRKSTTEIIRTFGETFKDVKNVELLCSVENPFPFDGTKSTEERIKLNKLNYSNVKYLKFPPRNDYVKYLQGGNVFVSCARSEGWNLPLIESMACGIPSIYSDWGGQLEFAKGKGVPVKITGLVDANIKGGNVGGQYCEPDFNDLRDKMIDVYNNYNEHRNKALDDAEKIHKEFNWEIVAKKASDVLEKKSIPNIENLERRDKVTGHEPKEVSVNFIDGPFVEIKDDKQKKYHVEFIDLKNGNTIFETDLLSNHWCRPNIKYSKKWLVKIKGVGNDYHFEHEFNPAGKRVLISFESKSLGDTIAWVPQVENYRKQTNSAVVCSTFLNKLFKDQYQNIDFVEPGSHVIDIYGLFRIGVFKNNEQKLDLDKHPSDPKNLPLGKICSDILGIEYVETKTEIPFLGEEKKKVVTIATHGTAQCKYWNNPTGWQEVVNYLISKGYEVKIVSREGDGYMGNNDPKNVTRVRAGSIENVIKEIQESEMFIGISSGLSWVSWASGIETILISGFTDDNIEPKNGIRRVINKNVCHGCWNKHEFDPGDWYWCPLHKDTERQFECSKTITSEDVIKEINLIREGRTPDN